VLPALTLSTGNKRLLSGLDPEPDTDCEGPERKTCHPLVIGHVSLLANLEVGFRIRRSTRSGSCHRFHYRHGRESVRG
jgi:hypothetical protein